MKRLSQSGSSNFCPELKKMPFSLANHILVIFPSTRNHIWINSTFFHFVCGNTKSNAGKGDYKFSTFQSHGQTESNLQSQRLVLHFTMALFFRKCFFACICYLEIADQLWPFLMQCMLNFNTTFKPAQYP